MTLSEYKKRIEQALLKKEMAQKEKEIIRQNIKQSKVQQIKEEKALILIREVSLQTQQNLEKQIQDLVTMGLNSVFDQDYQFVVQFVERREKTECDLYFEKEGHLIDPLSFSGLGAADVAAFCLRCVSWFLYQQQKTLRNVFLLDEPFKHLKGEQENKRALGLMKMLCKEMNIQIICINDERAPREDILQESDKVFEVQYRRGKSRIKEIKNA